jgi:hypothetical protein
MLDLRPVYNQGMVILDPTSSAFDDAVAKACHQAFTETLAAGLPVFYVDAQGLDILQRPGGRRFEVRWIPGGPAGKNYTVVRELTTNAA